MHNWAISSFKTLPLLLLGVLTTSQLQAADENASKDNDGQNVFNLTLKELLEVEVTVASAFSESLLQASSSVFVTPREQWRKQGNQNITAVLSHIPSVLSYTTLGSSTIAVRGFSHSTSVRGISTVLDGVPLNNYAFGSAFYDKINIDINSLDRIEMIRGPSSAIYGSDSFHGVVALQSYNSIEDEAIANAQMSNDGLYGVNLRISQAVGENHRLNIMLGGSSQDDKGLDYDYTDPDSGSVEEGQYAYQQEQQTAVFRLQSTPGKDLYYDAGLYLNAYESNDHPGIGTQFTAGKSQLKDRDWVDADTSFSLFKFSISKVLDQGITASFLTYLLASELEHNVDFTRNLGFQQLTKDEERKAGLKVDFKQADNAWNTEWLLSFSFDRANITEKTTTKFDQNNNLLSKETDFAQGNMRDTQAMVVQAKTRLLDDQLVLLYGGRLDNFSDIGNQLSPRAGIIYLPNHTSALKLLYGRAFRPPTAIELSGIGVAKGGEELQSEIIDTLEWVYMLQGEHWRSELLVFYSEWTNGIIIGDCLAVNGCDNSQFSGQYMNVSENESRGIELFFEGQWSGWVSRNSVSVVESKEKFSGQAYSAFPQWVINIDFGREFYSSSSEIYITNRIYLNMSEGPELSSTAGASETLSHFWRTDINLSKKLSKQSKVYFNIQNIFARDNFKPALWNNENGLEDHPRTVIAGIDYQF